jgi:hypothetical protein
MSERERLDATSDPISKGKNETVRDLSSNELDRVDGGVASSEVYELNTFGGNGAVSIPAFCR